MEKQISAVDFLIKEFSDIMGVIETTPMQNLLMVDGLTQAKELFELQIGKAFCAGYDYCQDRHIEEQDNDFEIDYFEQNFKVN